MESFHNEWIEYLRLQKLSDRTIKEYDRYFYSLKIESLDQDILNNWLKKHNNNVARAFLKKFINFLIENNYLDESQTLQLMKYEIPKIRGRKVKREIKVLTRSEVEDLARSVKNNRLRVLILTTFYLGLRRNEVLGLRFKDFVWDKQICKISHETAKGKKFRSVPVASRLIDILVDYLDSFPYEVVKQAHKNNELIFNRSKEWYSKKLNQASKKHLGYMLNIHSLRHSCGTYLKSKGMDLQEIANFLGHENIETTKIYARLDKELFNRKTIKIFEEEK